MSVNEKILWDYFMEKIHNPYGVAGLLGNLKAESEYKPNNLSSYGNRKLGMSDEEYTIAVDNRSYDNFVKDGLDYGLAQWVYYTRKQGLLDLARKNGKSIGDLGLQMDYIWQELNQYTAVLKVLKNTMSVKEATEAVMFKYEKPADTSDLAKAKRVRYAEEIFSGFSGAQSVDEKSELVQVVGENVYIRCGDSTNYDPMGIVSKGEKYELVAVSNRTKWYAIRYYDKVVWISPMLTKVVH